MAILAMVKLIFIFSFAICCQCSDPFSIEDFLTGRYSARSFGAQWVSDDVIQYRDGSGDVLLLNVATNETSTRLPSSVLTELKADSYTFSPDGSMLLVSYDTQAQFRHSTTARFKVVQLPSATNAIDIAGGAYLQSASWGPVGRSLIYIQNNDIYYAQDVTELNDVQITNSGVPGIIYNGVPDWVYEEEVLASGTAYWFSPSGDWLVYLQFNDTNVPEMTYQRYGQPGTLQDQYPQEITIRYPKAGANNPTHRGYLVNLRQTGYPVKLISEQDHDSINYGFMWGGNETIAELIMSRVQNESQLVIRNIEGKITQVLSFESPRGWIYTDSFKLDRLGKYSLSIESWGSGTGESSGNWSHLVLRNLQNNEQPKALTSGEITVLSIIDWQEEKNRVYYTATQENKPFVSHVYYVDIATGDSQCLSCGIMSPEGNNCSFATASFSSDFTYTILSCSAPDPRVVALYKNSIPIGNPVSIFEDNAALRQDLKSKSLPTTVDTVLGGAVVRLFLPVEFNSSSKYPLLINVYAGPGSNQITDGYSVNWGTYLTSSLGIVYGLIDGRGSARRGDNNLFSGYRALGTVEIEDQIHVTRSGLSLNNNLLIKEMYSWVDENRVGIWGWSYGGYATGRALELDTENVFKCGISVAPVTSWLYSDSVYTERYMGLPTENDNLVNYQHGDLVSNVENLKTKQYYLIHGNADDNVHYQQSMLLSRALEIDDVLFQQQSYPDENHSLGGVSKHLYHSMDKFWKDCFEISS